MPDSPNIRRVLSYDCTMKIFTSVQEALRQGYTIYDRTATGYLARIKTTSGLWALALINVKG